MIKSDSKIRLMGFSALLLALVSGCTARPIIQLVGFEFQELESDEEILVLTISSKADLRAIADKLSVNPVGILHICSQSDRYLMVEPLHEAAVVRGNHHIYTFRYPAALSRLVVFPPQGGEIQAGWPAETVQSKGVCFNIEGGSFGVAMITNVVKLPELEKQLRN